MKVKVSKWIFHGGVLVTFSGQWVFSGRDMSEDTDTVRLVEVGLEDLSYEAPTQAPQFSKIVFPFPK